MTDDSAFKRQIRARMAATGVKYTEARRQLLTERRRSANPVRLSLFDDIERHDASPATYAEDSFGFLNRAAGLVWERIREVLDAWFAAYPADHAADLRGKFRSKRAGQHSAAWWELYLHHLFGRLDYDVQVHPEIPHTSARPDFLLSRGEERLFVEAAVVFSGIVDEQRDGMREGWVIDAANRGTSRTFCLGIEFESVGAQKPRDRDVYEPLEAWLEGLDPDAVAAERDAGQPLPTKLIEIVDWRVRFEAHPIAPELRGERPGRLVGIGPASAGFIDDKEQLRDTLKHKRGRYPDEDTPLVVAVNCVGSFPKDEDIAAALYGSIGVQYVVDRPGSAKSVRLRDGTWMGKRGPTGRGLSAVLSAVQLHPHTAVKEAPQLWHNRWARRPVHVSWPFTEWRCSDEGLVRSEPRTCDLATLLDVPSEWPGPERPWD
jgi:hypothetical protein